MATSNYGVTMTKGGTSVGKIVMIDPPTIATESIDITNHSSGGKKSRMPSSLVDWEEFSCTILDEGTAYTDVVTDIEAGSVEQFVLTTPTNTYTFSGWYRTADYNEADGTDDDSSKFEVVVDLDPVTMIVS